MELRSPKPDDQDEAEKAFQILKECVINHPTIEPNIWAAAFWSVLISAYVDAGLTYKQFYEELENVRENYADWFYDPYINWN